MEELQCEKPEGLLAACRYRLGEIRETPRMGATHVFEQVRAGQQRTNSGDKSEHQRDI